MDIYLGGPTVAALRRAIGTRTTLMFGMGDAALQVQVEGLLAIGYRDLPFHIPENHKAPHSMEATDIWLITGGAEAKGPEPQALDVAIIYSPSTKIAAAVSCSNDEIHLVPWFPLRDLFLRQARRNLKHEL